LARKPRISAAEEEQARSRAEIAALAERLPVTDGSGGPPWGGVPLEVQIFIRDQARELLERGEATPEAADRLWARLPSYWRRQFRDQGVATLVARSRGLLHDNDVSMFDEDWHGKSLRGGRWR
jgi:hypothetical protein